MNIRNAKVLMKNFYGKKLKGKHIPLMWVGASGVGKSQVIDQVGHEIAKEFDLPDFETKNIRLSQKEQGDLVGNPEDVEMVPCPYCVENGVDEFTQDLLHKKQKILEHVLNAHKKHFKNKKEPTYTEIMELIRAKYSHLVEIRTGNNIPDFLPTKGHGILFLDEINRAQKGTRDAVFEFIENGCIGEYKLPPGWMIVSAVNPSNDDRYMVYELDEAMRRRFIWLLFCPVEEEWHSFAANKGLNKTVRQFFREYPKFLGIDFVDYPFEVQPCPRAAEFMADALEDLPDELVYEVAAGCIGTNGATSYMAMLRDKHRPVAAKDILNNYKKIKKRIVEFSNPKKNRADLLRASLDDILAFFNKHEEKLTDEQVYNVYQFMRDIPKDLTVGFIKLMTKSDSENTERIYRQLSNSDEVRKLMQDNFSSIGSG